MGIDTVGATYRYRERIREAIAAYAKQIREVWKVYEEPVPITQDCASAMINAWGILRVAWAKADMLLQQERAQCLEEEMWADDGGRNLE